MAGARPASRLNKAKKQNQKKGKTDLDDNGSKMDEALLKQPMETSVIGLNRVLKVLENGTSEVRNYLSSECDIIYECRVCRSLFRSLSNFISHKRLYCQELYENSLSFNRKFKDDEELYIQSENNLRQEEDEDEQEVDKKSKDLNSIIDRLGKKVNNVYQVNTTKLLELPIVSEEDTKNVLSLQNMDTSSSAMFQTISENVSGENEFIKNELMELHMMENEGAVIGPDGFCLGFRENSNGPSDSSETQTNAASIVDNFNSDKIVCEKCNQKFSTRKTLRFHINTKHNESRLVYPCPDCSETFVNPWGVYRHLLKAHRKTAPEVRKLRKVVQNSSFQMDQAPVSSHKRARNSTTVVPEAAMTEQELLMKKNEEWMESLEGDNDLQCCGGCGRRFERKAALHSHSLMCQKRIAACNKFKRAVQMDEKMAVKAKSSVRKSTIVKKKSDDSNFDKYSSDLSNVEESRPSSAADNPENLLFSAGLQSRKNSSASADKLILSDDESLEEVPVKDPLGVSDTEDNVDEPNVPSTGPPTQPVVVNSELNVNKTKSVKEVATSGEKDANETINSSSSVQPPITPTLINDLLAVRMKAFTNVGKRFVCMPCDYRYSSLQSLRRHMAIHFNWKRFRCLRCEFMSFDKRESIVHAQTIHYASLDVIKKFVARMTENESDFFSSKIFLPLNTTPQEIITLDDSDDDSNKNEQLNQQGQQSSTEDSKDSNSLMQKINSDDSPNCNDFSRNLIMEMIIGVSEPPQKINISSNTLNSLTEKDSMKIELSSTDNNSLSAGNNDVENLENCETKVNFTDCSNISVAINNSDCDVARSNSSPLTPTISVSSAEESSPSTASASPKTTVAATSSKKTSVALSRPVRNRVKPVNKDFIYDMSALTRDCDIDDSYNLSKSKRKLEPNDLDLSKMMDADYNAKKKKRRNSKVYATETNECVRIIPIDFNHPSSSRMNLDGFIDKNSQNSDEKPEFVIHSVMSSVDM